MGCYDAMDGERWVDEKLAARVGSLSIRRDDVTGSTGWSIGVLIQPWRVAIEMKMGF